MTWLERRCAGIAREYHAALAYIGGFCREHAPESSTRLVMILFGATACVEAHRIVSFAFANPKEHQTVLELTGILTVLVGTGVGAMALRTRSADSAAARAQQLLNRAADALPADTPAGSGEHA